MVDWVQPKPFKAGFKTGRYDPSGMQPAIKVTCPSPLTTACKASSCLFGGAVRRLRAREHTQQLCLPTLVKVQPVASLQETLGSQAELCVCELSYWGVMKTLGHHSRW